MFTRTTQRRVTIALIFIADDDDIVLDLVARSLRAAGHRVGTVTNGKDILAAIQNKNPDLVILDCSMPECSGISVLQKLRNSIKYFDLPVIMLTGRRGEVDVGIAMSEGANDYIKKPFDPDFVAFRVDEALEKKHRYPADGSRAKLRQ